MPCHRHLVQVHELLGEIPLMTVGFSPPAALTSLADHLGLPGLVLADERRVLYRALALPRAPLWRIYSPRTLAFYGRARRSGRRARPPVEDTRQLGGDALVVGGVVVRRWLPRTPVDRARPEVIAAAARAGG
ncbi:MAG: hypothetical protein ACT4RN_10120 [Pseudonocardia sp.]